MTLWSPCALKHVMWQRVFLGASEFKLSTELDMERVILQFMCVGSLTGVTYLRYTVLTSPNKGETAVHCCDPPLSVLVMLVSRNVFHVVSALQSIVFILFFGGGGGGDQACRSYVGSAYRMQLVTHLRIMPVTYGEQGFKTA